MANQNLVIPFVLHFAAGVCGPRGKHLLLPLHHQFELARSKGWSDDPDDPGGATMIDVTLATFRQWRKLKGMAPPTKTDLRNISFSDWHDVMKTLFWDKIRGSEIESQALANMIFDWVWASGTGSIRNLQRIAGTNPDGIFGPATLAAVNDAPGPDLFMKIRNERERHYRNCRAAWKYLNGWLRRLNAIRPDGTFAIP